MGEMLSAVGVGVRFATVQATARTTRKESSFFKKEPPAKTAI
jgi:hypothetical protein